MAIDNWERIHRSNIRTGSADVSKHLIDTAKRVAQRIKNLQSNKALSAKKYGEQLLKNKLETKILTTRINIKKTLL